MRCEPERQATMLLALKLGGFVPNDQQLWRIKPLADSELRRMSLLFDEIYAASGRPSITPEHLLHASLLKAFYTVRSGRQFNEQPRDDQPPLDGGHGGRNHRRDFKGERRRSETRELATDPEARPYHKGPQR